MTIRRQTELIQPKDTVQLTATFRDASNSPADTDTFPSVTIIAPSGLVSVGPTSAGVQHLGPGRYQFDYTVGFSPGLFGVWAIVWQGEMSGFNVEATFNFVVNTTDQPALNTDGYWHLGDSVGYDYSQIEIFNIDKLLQGIRARLNSRGKSRSTDNFGNVIYVDCDIFSVDMLVAFLGTSISLFNEIPHITFFTFADSGFIDQFFDVLVEGAVVLALASQALIERGREFQITDSGINFQPPTMSELLNTQYSQLLTHNYEKVKFIKNTFKPHPLGLSGYAPLGGYNPAIRKLRLLRSRQII